MSLVIAILLAILLVSALCAWWLVSGKDAENPVKVMMFVGYFWLLTFVQLLVAVICYLGWQRFFMQPL